jgi:hypothetical protein
MFEEAGGGTMSDMDMPRNQLAEFELEDNGGDGNYNGQQTKEWGPVEDNNAVLFTMLKQFI